VSKEPEHKDEKKPLTRADVETILETGAHRKALLDRLRAAILAGNTLLEHEIARELAGLPKEIPQ
jgi:hypothetical protein